MNLKLTKADDPALDSVANAEAILHDMQIRNAFELGKKHPLLSFEEAVRKERWAKKAA